MRVERKGQIADVICTEDANIRWRLVCQGHKWSGDHGNCTHKARGSKLLSFTIEIATISVTRVVHIGNTSFNARDGNRQGRMTPHSLPSLQKCCSSLGYQITHLFTGNYKDHCFSAYKLTDQYVGLTCQLFLYSLNKIFLAKWAISVNINS